MSRPYRTKKLNAARCALLGLLSKAKDRKIVARFSLPQNPLAALAKKFRKSLKKTTPARTPICSECRPSR